MIIGTLGAAISPCDIGMPCAQSGAARSVATVANQNDLIVSPPERGKLAPIGEPASARLAAMQQRIYMTLHDFDQRHPPRLPRLFREERPRSRGVGAFGPPERPDSNVRQRRHGAVQERLHRPRNAAL